MAILKWRSCLSSTVPQSMPVTSGGSRPCTRALPRGSTRLSSCCSSMVPMRQRKIAMDTLPLILSRKWIRFWHYFTILINVCGNVSWSVLKIQVTLWPISAWHKFSAPNTSEADNYWSPLSTPGQNKLLLVSSIYILAVLIFMKPIQFLVWSWPWP